MANTLRFRGGSTTDIASSTVSDREIVFDTDKNTLVLGSAKDYLMRYGGNSQSGNVGIGVASPSTALDVNGTVTATAFAGPITGNVTGNLTAGSGTVAAPSVSVGTSDNGLYSSGADQVSISTNGTQAITVDSSQNVGIGTSSPSANLEVAGATYANIFLTDTAAGASGAIYGDEGAIDLRSNNSTDNSYLVTSGSQRIRVSGDELGRWTSTGLGIGTTSPDYKLHVNVPISSGFERTAQFANGTDSNFKLVAANGSNSNATDEEVSRFGIYYEGIGWDTYTQYIRGGGQQLGSLAFSTANTERVRIDSSGKVLVGTSASRTNLVIGNLAAQLQVEGTTHSTSSGSFIRNSNDSNNAYLTLGKTRGTANGSNTIVQDNDGLGNLSFLGADGTNLIRAAEIRAEVDGTPGTNDMPGALIFSTTADGASSPTERMRITSSGHIQIHQNSSPVPGHNNTVTGACFEKATNGTTLFVSRGDDVAIHANRNNNGNVVSLRRSGTKVGSISVTTSSTSYNTSSDYRLKENVVNLDGAIDRVKQLAPKRFNFISDGDTTVDGFLAHEAQVVVPEAVTGTYNEVDDDGNAVMQGIDQSKLVPLLTAALQEAIARIEALENS